MAYNTNQNDLLTLEEYIKIYDPVRKYVGIAFASYS